MVHLIVGTKGKGKTRILIDSANERIKEAKGDVVYLDQSLRHIHELNNKIRLVNVKDFDITNKDEIIGFFNGIISQNWDIEMIYMEGLPKLSDINDTDISYIVHKLVKICEAHNVELTLGLSMNAEDLDEDLKPMIQTSL